MSGGILLNSYGRFKLVTSSLLVKFKEFKLKSRDNISASSWSCFAFKLIPKSPTKYLPIWVRCKRQTSNKSSITAADRKCQLKRVRLKVLRDTSKPVSGARVSFGWGKFTNYRVSSCGSIKCLWFVFRYKLGALQCPTNTCPLFDRFSFSFDAQDSWIFHINAPHRYSPINPQEPKSILYSAFTPKFVIKCWIPHENRSFDLSVVCPCLDKENSERIRPAKSVSLKNLYRNLGILFKSLLRLLSPPSSQPLTRNPGRMSMRNLSPPVDGTFAFTQWRFVILCWPTLLSFDYY